MASILSNPHLFPFFLFTSAGLLMLLLNALAQRPTLAARISAGVGAGAMAALTGLAGGALLLNWPATFWICPLVVVLFYAVFFLIPSPTCAAVMAWLSRKFAMPRVRSFAVIACASAALATSLAVTLQQLEPEYSDDSLAAMVDAFREEPRLLEVPGVQAVTDRGRPVILRTNPDHTPNIDPEKLKEQNETLARLGLRDQVIHLTVGWRNCNCHGWVFTAGQYFVTSDQVDMILKDNRYRAVDVPGSGDVAVYRDDEGKVTHTGIVRYVSANSNLVLVESKWGRLGRFIHPHDVHCYGRNECTFYRSSRVGHRLQGVSPEGSSVPNLEQIERYLPTRATPVSRAS